MSPLGILIGVFLLILVALPLFVGATRGQLGLGLGWCLASLAVPGVLWFVAVNALEGGTSAGLSVLLSCGALFVSVVLPLVGTQQVLLADKRRRVLEEIRSRKRRRR